MGLDWTCPSCLATFSRPEHLRRHAAATHDNTRPHTCSFCQGSFNRKDVLRRLKRTCKHRAPSIEEKSTENYLQNFDSTEFRQMKRLRSSVNEENLSNLVATTPEGIDPTAITAGSENGHDTHLIVQNVREDITFQTGNTNDRSPPWLRFDPELLNITAAEVGPDFPNIPSPLNFSDLDFLLLPQAPQDISIAERLEHMVYFTSSIGMATFADRESFQRKQNMASESYDKKTDPEKTATRTNPAHKLQAKSEGLVENLRNVICDKKNDDVITLEWSPATYQLCCEFFSPPNIHRFLEYFWSLWYPHCPIVHKPLFDTSSASPGLLCVMVIIGACLSPNEKDNEVARKWLDSVEELIFRHKCSRSDRTADSNVSFTEGVQAIQAAYLVSSLQKREGTVEAQARMRRHRHASMVTLARHIGVIKASHRNLTLESPTRSWWRQFAQEEELIRSMIFVFLIDAALAIFHNSPPRTLVSELKMDVACPEACFQAESAEECLGGLRVWASTRFWKNRLSIVSVVRRICQSPIDDSLAQELSQLGTVNLFTIIQAIHLSMFHLHNSLVFESTMTPVQTGLENWRLIWNKRVPEDENVPETPENLWKQVGFLRHASEFWHLARIIARKIMSSSQNEDCGFEEESTFARYDHTDMGDVNGLIVEYRRLNLGVV